MTAKAMVMRWSKKTLWRGLMTGVVMLMQWGLREDGEAGRRSRSDTAVTRGSKRRRRRRDPSRKCARYVSNVPRVAKNLAMFNVCAILPLCAVLA